MTDLNILFLVFGFFVFCIILSEMTSPDDSLLTFEERTKAYKDSEDVIWDAYHRYNEATDYKEKKYIMEDIKKLENESNYLYSMLSHKDRMKLLSDVADGLNKTSETLKKTADAIDENNLKLKESNDKLRIAVESMEQRIKEST